MSAYLSRLKRNRRDAASERDAMLARIQTMREVMDNYAERDPDGAKLIFEMLSYIESGQLPDDYADVMRGLH
jgi:hypothetical protein